MSPLRVEECGVFIGSYRTEHALWCNHSKSVLFELAVAALLSLLT